MNALHLLRVTAAGTGPPAGATVPPGLLEGPAAALGDSLPAPHRPPPRPVPLDRHPAGDGGAGGARGSFTRCDPARPLRAGADVCLRRSAARRPLCARLAPPPAGRGLR